MYAYRTYEAVRCSADMSGIVDWKRLCSLLYCTVRVFVCISMYCINSVLNAYEYCTVNYITYGMFPACTNLQYVLYEYNSAMSNVNEGIVRHCVSIDCYVTYECYDNEFS